MDKNTFEVYLKESACLNFFRVQIPSLAYDCLGEKNTQKIP